MRRIRIIGLLMVFFVSLLVVDMPVEAAPTVNSVTISGDKSIGSTLTGHYDFIVNGFPEGDTSFRWLRVPIISSLLGEPYLLYSTNNIAGVGSSPSGPDNPAEFTVAGPSQIEKISNYHYSTYDTPGTISLVEEDGTEYGPWQAKTEPATAGQYWIVYPDIEIPAGTYTVVDAKPNSWSFNSASGYAGMTEVLGYEAIVGATESSYLLQNDDYNDYLMLEVTPRNSEGEVGEPKLSSPYGPIGGELVVEDTYFIHVQAVDYSNGTSIIPDTGVSFTGDGTDFDIGHEFIVEFTIHDERYQFVDWYISSYGIEPEPIWNEDDSVSGVINGDIWLQAGFNFVEDTNSRPTASNDAVTTVQGVPITIDVLANDSDPDGDLLQIISVSELLAYEGTLAIIDNQLLYSPDEDFTGTVEFSYDISDFKGGTDSAQVKVTIEPMVTVDPPIVVLVLSDKEGYTPSEIREEYSIDGIIRTYGDLSNTTTSASFEVWLAEPRAEEEDGSLHVYFTPVNGLKVRVYEMTEINEKEIIPSSIETTSERIIFNLYDKVGTPYLNHTIDQENGVITFDLASSIEDYGRILDLSEVDDYYQNATKALLLDYYKEEQVDTPVEEDPVIAPPDDTPVKQETKSKKSVKFDLTVSSTEGGSVPGFEGTHSFNSGTRVVLNTVAEEGYEFVRFEGDTETLSEGVLILAGDKSIHAVFEPIEAEVEEEVTEEVVDETIPETTGDVVEEEILNEVIPEADPLPQTGGLPLLLYVVFGGAFVGLGIESKRKR